MFRAWHVIHQGLEGVTRPHYTECIRQQRCSLTGSLSSQWGKHIKQYSSTMLEYHVKSCLWNATRRQSCVDYGS